MKCLFQFVLIFLSIFIIACTSKDAQTNADQIDKLINDLVQNKKSAGISYKIEIGTALSRSNHNGSANLLPEVTIKSNSQFRIASITKSITATAIMQLIEQGFLSEMETIDRFFPDFPNADKITIYQLLSHTSGIPNWWGWDGELPSNTPENFPMCPEPHLYIQTLDNYTQLFNPGTQYAYSNSGYILLGEIIEIISGLSYENYLRKNIFDPAIMNYTELEYIDLPGTHYVHGYAWKDFNFNAPEQYPMPFSAGGLRSTSEDLMNFLSALRNGKLVSKGTFEKMTSYARLNDGRFTYENMYSDQGEIHFPKNIKKYGYGLGFQIVENYGTKVISHGGDIAGFNSILMFIPKNELSLVILSNTEGGILSNLLKIEMLATSVE